MSDAPLEDLPPEQALEIDAVCDDFERHWRRARRRGLAPPSPDAFLARGHCSTREVLRQCLTELEGDLRRGILLPEVPGLAVEEEIGRGGMGVVYRAHRLEDGRAVALKLIPGAEHARWSRWLEELADLRHPNLVPFEAFGSHEGLHYVVMPLVRGGDLKERLDEFVVSSTAALRKVAALTARVAGAVAFLHRRGILHRDLKPSNILLSAACGLAGNASEGTAKPQAARQPASLSYEPLVCDFGLAGRLDEAGPEVAGTPPYMAPEQMEGLPPTAAADVWSLGAVLYELLTARPPFTSRGELDHASKRASEPPPPRCLNAAVDEALQRICLACLRRQPEMRYPSAAGLAADLECYLEECP